MIRNIHVDVLREQVAQAERDLAGWQYLLKQAEQGERAATVMPDPLMPAGAPWPAPPANPWRPPATPVHGRDPYPAAPAGPVFDGRLPVEQEAKLNVFEESHDELAKTPDAVREEQKWRTA